MKQRLPAVAAGLCLLALNACATNPGASPPLAGGPDTQSSLSQLKIDPTAL